MWATCDWRASDGARGQWQTDSHQALRAASEVSTEDRCRSALALRGGVWCASATVVHGRVYVGTGRMDFWVLKAGREKEVLAKGRTKSTAITTVVGEGTFFLTTQRRILAVGMR